MRPPLCVLALAVTAILVPTNARGEFFSLPELIGPAPIYNVSEPIVVQFDLGREFTEVHDVLLMLEAIVTPLTFQYCGTSYDPQPCELRVVNSGFLVRLDDPIGFDTYASIEGFRSNLPTKNAGVFQRSFLDFSFDHLRDGQATLYSIGMVSSSVRKP